MRYFQEYRHKFSGASGVAIDAGKRLLGYLANQKRLSGVDSLVQRIAVKDESGAVWTVEARFDKSIPSVRIFPPGSGEAACEMYVESGLLDLGPNIASDASQRFNRGLPAFNDDPATLYFGDGVECVDGQPGLNGTIRLQGQSVASGCLPSTGNGIASRLSDPVKKQAQALLPASCWSGLMQRYVQAVYGGGLLSYSATATALTIGEATLQVADTIGLLNLNGVLGFLSIDGGTLTLRQVSPVNECVLAVLNAWRGMPEGETKTRMLTVALSGCVIGQVIATGTIEATGNRHFTNRAAWVFAHGDAKAVAVLEDSGVATAYQATFSLDGDTILAELETLATGDVMNAGDWPLLVADQSPYASPSAHGSGFSEGDFLGVGESYDFPVYAFYEGDAPVVVFCSVITSDLAIPDMSDCFNIDDPFGPVLIGTDASRQCRTSIDVAVQVAYGFYATGWSTVGLTTCFVDDGKVVRSRDAGFQGVSIGEVDEVNLTEAGDLRGLVLFAGLSGPMIGFGLCATLNEAFGALTTYDDDLPDPVPCVTSYSYEDTDPADTGTTELTRLAAPASGAVFEGRAHGSGLQVLSLAWGATSCCVADSYTFAGGEGAYISFTGYSFPLAEANDPVYTYAAFSVETVQTTLTYNTPGDCGSGTTVTDVSTVTATYTSTAPSAVGDLVLGLWGFAAPVRTDDRLAMQYVSDTARFPTSPMAYPDPRMRGVETLAVSVFMGATTDDYTETHGVSIALPAGNVYEHPDGLTTFTANDDTGGVSDAFEYLGLQELTDAHIETDLADGDDKPLALEDVASPTWLVEGFAYQAARSLLGAAVVPTAMRERGASVNMDRQTITGGYTAVNTPSFVGWA